MVTTVKRTKTFEPGDLSSLWAWFDFLHVLQDLSLIAERTCIVYDVSDEDYGSIIEMDIE